MRPEVVAQFARSPTYHAVVPTPLEGTLLKLAGTLGVRSLRRAFPATDVSLTGALGEACDAVDRRLGSGFGDVLASTFSAEDSCSAFVGLLVFAARADLHDELREASSSLLPTGIDPDFADVDVGVFLHELSVELHTRIRMAALRSSDPLFNWFTIVSNEADAAAEARRQDDLLRAVGDIRTDQLALPPSSRLERLQSTRVPIFVGVPSCDPAFVGRDGELQALREALDVERRAVITQVVTGLGGVGKSALAAEYCHRYRGDYKLVRWITASSPELASSRLMELAASLEIEASRLPRDEAIAALFHKLNVGWAPWLVVLDNVDHPSWIEQLLALGAEGHILITSRYGAWEHLAVAPMPLGPVRISDAIEILTSGNRASDGVPSALVSELDGLPLALRQARAYCQTRGMRYSDYLLLLRTRRSEVVRRDALASSSARTLMSVLLTSLEAATRETPLARSILRTCAYLPPRGTPRSLLLRPNASEEPLLAYGDEVEVSDALAALAQFSLITLEPPADDAGASVSVHRVVQHLARVDLGEDALEFSELATRLLRAGGDGWSYHLDDAGRIIVAVDRASGRMLASRPSQDSAVAAELRDDSGIPNRPLWTGVTTDRIIARYEAYSLGWDLPARLSSTTATAVAISGQELADQPAEAHTRVVLRDFDPNEAALSDMLSEGYRVSLPDGRLLLLSWAYDGFDARIEGSERTVTLHPGWYGRRSVEAAPVVDPTGEWLIVSMETTKHYDHGWLAAWQVSEILTADDGGGLSATEFHPNGVPYEDDDNASASFASTTALAFSHDGARIFMLDSARIQCWSWPTRKRLWDHARPDHIPRLRRPRLDAHVSTANALRARNTLRCVLRSGEVIDVDASNSRVSPVGHVDGEALAVSSLGGGVLLGDGSIVLAGAEQRRSLRLTAAVVDRTGAFFAIDDEGVIYRSDGTQPLQELCGLRLPGAVLLAADTLGGRVVLRRGGDAISVRLRGDRIELDEEPIYSGPNGGSRASTALLNRIFGEEADAVRVTAATVGPDGGLYVGNVHQELHMPGVWTFAGGLITAMAIEAGTLLFGLADGRLRVRAPRQRLTAEVSEHPILWLIAELGSRRVTVLDDHGLITIVEWG